MPLPKSTQRRKIHTRVVECHGYHRDDGLWDIEGHLTDVKTDTFSSPQGRTVPAEEPIHEMCIRLTIDEELVVHDIVAVTEHAPYPACPAAASALSSLRGSRIAAGWSSEVRRRLGGKAGCTHLREMLGPLATTAYQTLTAARSGRPESLDKDGRPVRIDSCYAYASDGELARLRWPHLFTGEPSHANTTPADDQNGHGA